MKLFVGALLVAQTILQITNSQVIRNVANPVVSSCSSPVINPCGCSGPIINPCSCSGPIINPCSCSGPIINPCGCSGPIINPCGCNGPIINPCGYSGPIINPCTGPIMSPCCDPYGLSVVTPTVYQSNSVAASLADTLSLLTVSSLLADVLPLGGCGCGGYGCGYPCGCGCGCAYGGYC